jgi:hypothetical protein
MVVALLAAIVASDYTQIEIEGWTVKVHREAIERSTAWTMARRELETQLYRIVRVVPDAPLAKLREVEIWVHQTSPWTKCMAYHPGAQWLREHDMNPEMEKDVEIGNVAAFVDWTYEQPWMVLHELAHAYHDRFLKDGFANSDVLAAFDKAKKGRRYERVLRWNARSERHYALTNQMEYFAEATEAYFGTNDFFPFVRPELQTFDPDGYALMERVWGKPQKRIPEG